MLGLISSSFDAKCLSAIFRDFFKTGVVERWLVNGKTKLEDSSGSVGRMNHRVVGQDDCRDAVLHTGKLLQKDNQTLDQKNFKLMISFV